VDFKNFNSSKEDVYLLSGEWEFYWNQFLYDKDFERNPIPDAIVSIPSVWNSYKDEGIKTKGYGYATYRLHVVNAKVGDEIGIRISPLSTAYRLYIDNKLMAQSGSIGKNKKEAKAAYQLNVFSFTPNSSEFDIIIQISNFTYARGGLWYAPQVSSTNQIYQLHNMTLYRDILLIGCFVVMLIHSIVIYLLRRKEKSYLIFAIMCLTIIARISVYSSYSIGEVFRMQNLNLLVRMEYISLLWMANCYMVLTDNQFKYTISGSVRKIYSKIVLIFTIFILFTPIRVFTMGIYLLEAICLSAVIYTIIKLCRSYSKGMQNTIFLILSSSVFGICSLHDLLIQSNVVSGSATEYMPIGFLLFMISEDFILARNYINTMQKNEEMIQKIEYVTRNEYETNLKFLKSQIKPHFIHNALNSIIAVSRLDAEKSRELLYDFSQYLRNSFDFDNLDQFVSVDHELNFIRSYLSIEKTRFGEALTIEYDIENTKIRIPSLILEPLVENAVKHGICKKIDGGYGHWPWNRFRKSI
jgi:sensor histidine kinase YesM